MIKCKYCKYWLKDHTSGLGNIPNEGFGNCDNPHFIDITDTDCNIVCDKEESDMLKAGGVLAYNGGGIDGMGDYANVYVHSNFGCIHGMPKYVPKFAWYIRSQDGINESDMESRSAASGYRFSAQDVYAYLHFEFPLFYSKLHTKMMQVFNDKKYGGMTLVK